MPKSKTLPRRPPTTADPCLGEFLRREQLFGTCIQSHHTKSHVSEKRTLAAGVFSLTLVKICEDLWLFMINVVHDGYFLMVHILSP